MKIVHAILFAAAFATSGTMAVAASSTGTIRGNARPHEQIVVVNATSGAVVGVMSDSAGHFEATGLPAGQYSVARAHEAGKTTGAPVIAGRITDVVLPKE